jgi:NAD-dependent DNA ligase
VARSLRDAPAEAFTAVPGIGPVVAKSIGRFFGDDATGGLLEDLVAAGVVAERPVVRRLAGVGTGAGAGAGAAPPTAAEGPLTGETP